MRRSSQEDNWASDYLTDDAPVRNAHHREVFESTEASFLVEVRNPDTDEIIKFNCEPGEFILDAADRAGLELPYSCRSGGCLSCSGKIISGQAEMAEQYVLEEEHTEAGFILLCCTEVHSDAVFLSHQEDMID